jgi:hypothetical protein
LRISAEGVLCAGVCLEKGGVAFHGKLFLENWGEWRAFAKGENLAGGGVKESEWWLIGYVLGVYCLRENIFVGGCKILPANGVCGL